MKTRLGFVSNSSSSSYIMGYGRVKDRELFDKYISDNKIELEYNLYFLDYKTWNYEYNSDFEICGGNDTCVILPEELRTEETFIARVTNDEGDSEFSTYDKHGDWDGFNYDRAREISFYDEKQQAIINLFSQPFMENSFVKFGAERNG